MKEKISDYENCDDSKKVTECILEELSYKGCMDVKGKNGKEATICIATSKDFGKRDIIFVPKNNENAFSVRSVTELGNKLKKLQVPHEEIIKTIGFASEGLRDLESEKTRTEVETPIINVKRSKEIK